MDIKRSYYETLYSRPVVQLAGYCAKYSLPLPRQKTRWPRACWPWPRKRAF